MNLDRLIESYKEDMINTVIELVSIPSVEGEPEKDKPFGKAVDDALNYVLDFSEKLGLSVKNVDYYAGHAEYGEGDETIGVVLHLDVVPAGDDWTYEPFKPKLIDNRIYGRGTTDNKGPTVAILYAIKALIELDAKLSRKIRVIFGTNEETRWEGIHYYLKKEAAPDMTIVPDALFPMIYAEKGIVDYTIKMPVDTEITSLKGGNAINSVADRCEVSLKVSDTSLVMDQLKKIEVDSPFLVDYYGKDDVITLSVKGVAAHTSEPQLGANAIGYMSHLITRVLNVDSFSFISEYFGYNDYLGHSLGIECEDEPSGKLTNNVGLISYENGSIIMKVNTRYPVTMNYDEYLNKLMHSANKQGYELNVDDHLAPVYKSLDSKEAELLIETYRKKSGDYKSEPISMGGGTYARALPNAITYGGQMQGDPVVPHQSDEYLTLENLELMTKIYAEALYQLGVYEGKLK